MLLKFNSNQLLNHFVDEDSDEEVIYSIEPRPDLEPSFYQTCIPPHDLITSSSVQPPIPFDFVVDETATAPDSKQVEVLFIETSDAVVTIDNYNIPKNSFCYYHEPRNQAYYSFQISKTILIPGAKLYFKYIDWLCGVETPETICSNSSVIVAIDPISAALYSADTRYAPSEPYEIQSDMSFYRNIKYDNTIRRMYPRGICPECFGIQPSQPSPNDPLYFATLQLPPDASKTSVNLSYLSLTAVEDIDLTLLIFMEGGCERYFLNCTAFYNNIINRTFTDVWYMLVVTPKDVYVTLKWCSDDPGICSHPTNTRDVCYFKSSSVAKEAYPIERSIKAFYESFLLHGTSFYSKLDVLVPYSSNKPQEFYLREDVVPYKTEFFSDFGSSLKSVIAVFLLFESTGYTQEVNATLTLSRYKYSDHVSEDTLEIYPFVLTYQSNYRNSDSKALLCWYAPSHIMSSNVTKISVTIAEEVVGRFTFFYHCIDNTCTKNYVGLPVCSGECIDRTADWNIGGDALKVGHLDSIHKTKNFESEVQFGNKYNV